LLSDFPKDENHFERIWARVLLPKESNHAFGITKNIGKNNYAYESYNTYDMTAANQHLLSTDASRFELESSIIGIIQHIYEMTCDCSAN
jgi:hypothetical protein